MKDLLINLGACKEAQDWAGDKSWQEIFETCHRGDWLLWLFKKTNPNDLQALTLAKGHCANTVRHLMKDERSIKAVDLAIAFGEGKVVTLEELHSAAADAYAAYRQSDGYDPDYTAACGAYAAYVDTSATYAADTAASAGYAADAAYAAAASAGYVADATYAAYAAAASAAKKENQQLTANICRKYLPIEIWNI